MSPTSYQLLYPAICRDEVSPQRPYIIAWIIDLVKQKVLTRIDFFQEAIFGSVFNTKIQLKTFIEFYCAAHSLFSEAR